jgi:hypothetical protein
MVEGRLTGEMKVIDLLISPMHAEERSWPRRPILVKDAWSRLRMNAIQSHVPEGVYVGAARKRT